MHFSVSTVPLMLLVVDTRMLLVPVGLASPAVSSSSSIGHQLRFRSAVDKLLCRWNDTQRGRRRTSASRVSVDREHARVGA